MIKWVWNFLLKLWNWGLDDRPRLARRVPRDETSDEVSGGSVAEWTEESIPELDDGSNAQRLEEEERDQRSRTSRLSVVDEGVGTEHQEVLDFSMKEHFFSPLNPNNK